MLHTRPTATSLTFTADCGTRSLTLVNSAVTWYGWLPRLAPPGSGMLYIPLNPPELHPATHSAVAAEISTAGMPGWRPRPRTAPPRRDRTALIGLPPSRALRWLRGAGPRRRDPATAP